MGFKHKYSDIFTFIDPNDMQILLKYMKIYQFFEEDIIIEKGQSDSFLGLIASGKLNVLQPNEKKNNKKLIQLTSGMVVGELSFFDGLPRSTTIQAENNGELLILNRYDYNKLVSDHPTVALNLTFELAKILSLRLRDTTDVFTVSKQKLILSRKQQDLNAKQDPLTQLPNRAAYDEKILDVYHQWYLKNSHFSITLLDIDHFKRFNDTYGHAIGDKVLQHVAKLARNSLRKNDFIARFGGEEFLIIFEKTKKSQAYIAANKLREIIKNNKLIIDNETISITASFGVTQITSSDNIDSIFNRADKALYKAKHQGRDCVIKL